MGPYITYKHPIRHWRINISRSVHIYTSGINLCIEEQLISVFCRGSRMRGLFKFTADSNRSSLLEKTLYRTFRCFVFQTDDLGSILFGSPQEYTTATTSTTTTQPHGEEKFPDKRAKIYIVPSIIQKYIRLSIIFLMHIKLYIDIFLMSCDCAGEVIHLIGNIAPLSGC